MLLPLLLLLAGTDSTRWLRPPRRATDSSRGAETQAGWQASNAIHFKSEGPIPFATSHQMKNQHRSRPQLRWAHPQKMLNSTLRHPPRRVGVSRSLTSPGLRHNFIFRAGAIILTTDYLPMGSHVPPCWGGIRSFGLAPTGKLPWLGAGHRRWVCALTNPGSIVTACG